METLTGVFLIVLLLAAAGFITRIFIDQHQRQIATQAEDEHKARITPDWHLDQRGDFTELHKWLAHHAPKNPSMGVHMTQMEYLAITSAITQLQDRVAELEQGERK